LVVVVVVLALLLLLLLQHGIRGRLSSRHVVCFEPDVCAPACTLLMYSS
jgi:hypothetical protein